MKSHKELMNLAAVLTVLVSSVCRMDAVRQDYSVHSGALQILDSLKTVHTRAEVSDTLPGAVPPLVLGDSVALYVADTLQAPDSVDVDTASNIFASDTAKGMLDMPAFSTAVDSVIEDFSSGRQMIYYYGKASVTYGDMTLKAEYMEYDVDRQVVYAAGVADTAGGGER